MCKYYAELKSDYLYRGDVLNAVPFVSLDAGGLLLQAPYGDQPLISAPFEEEQSPHQCSAPRGCVAIVERLPAVVITRTCEANKRWDKKKRRIYPGVMVAPVRPFAEFPVDASTGRPFHELVLEGFPRDGDEEQGQCYRFMVLPPCNSHGLPDGGMVCFREMQPVHLRHLLLAEKITRLSQISVGVLSERLHAYLEQTEEDYAADGAPEGPPSPIVASFNKKLQREAERGA